MLNIINKRVTLVFKCFVFRRCDRDSIPDVRMWNGHVVSKSDKWVYVGLSG